MERQRHSRLGGARVALVALLAFTLGAPPVLAQDAAAAYYLVIRGGLLLDGTGAPARRADIGIRDDRIMAVGELDELAAARVIDATGRHVTPGFIDTHSHATRGLLHPGLRTAHALLAQGITTVIANPDGGGPADLAAQRDTIERLGVGVNVARFVPHGAVRREVLGMQAREATPDELERMKELVADGMAQGAVGLSSGLYYAPGSYAPTGEVIELARVAARHGGAYQSHIRDESDYTVGLVEAVEEVIAVAREAGMPGVVTHIKALGPRVWGLSNEIVARIERARADGVEVFADQYPYEASGTSIVGALVPRWALAGGPEATRARLEDPDERARLVADIWENLDRRGGADRLVLQGGGPDLKGKSLQQVADERGVDPVEAAIQLWAEERDGGLTSFNMDENDIRTFMRQPWTMTSSDGILRALGAGQPHPRDFGAFPRKIRKYVLEEGVVSLEAAIHGMTGLPARVYRLADRGVVRPGAYADLLVFDPARLRDRATYDDPHHLSEGVEFALVNGRLAIDGGEFTDALAGRVLRRGQE